MKYSTYTLLFPVLATAVGVNPDPSFNPATSKGTTGPFAPPARAPAANAVGAPTTIDAATAKALQAACDNWSADTGKVSGFQDAGAGLPAGKQFNAAANVGFLAEVDELTHKAILDKTIGLDPQVSIANLTLTNGCFQSVVNNLQVMSIQGKATQGLINTINSIRCTQVLPSIDTYMAVAAKLIGPGATLRKAIRPAACAGIVAAAPASAFPNVPNVPGGTPLGQQAPAAGGAATGTGATAGTGGTGTTPATGTTTGKKGGKGGKGTAAAGASAAASSIAAGNAGSAAAVSSPAAASSVAVAGTAAAPSAAAPAAGTTSTTGTTGTAATTGKKAKRAKKAKKAVARRSVAFYA
jgi:hypothetical protein